MTDISCARWNGAKLVLTALCLTPFLSSPASAETTGDPAFGTALLTFYVKAKAADSDPYLSLDLEAPSVPAYVAKPATFGATSKVAAAQGDYGQPIEFVLDKELNQDYWLNVSAIARGKLRWTSTTLEAVYRSGTVLTELWLDDARVVGSAQGYADGAPAWHYVSFEGSINSPTGRVEVAKLPAGSKLVLKVFPISVHGDFHIGTGDPQASSFSFQYFDADPLGRIRYVVDGQTIPLPSSASEDNEGNAWTWAGAGGMAGLAALRVRAGKRQRAVLLLAALATVGISGCLGGADPASEPRTPSETLDSAPSVTVTAHPDGGLERLGNGAIEGYTLDGDGGGVPVSNANLFLVGTPIFTKSDRYGHYHMANVSQNTYRLHVDVDNFASVELDVPVYKGQRTWVNLSLQRPSLESGGQVPHLHDEWKGLTEKTLFDDSVTPGLPVAGTLWAAVYPGLLTYPTEVIVPYGELVLPGTAQIEVILDWPTGPGAPNELSFTLSTPTMRYDKYILFQRGPREPFHMPIMPNEADGAHQHSTTWRFAVLVPAARSSAVLASDLRVDVLIKIHKGVVPYEPAHPLFWNGATELPIFEDYTTSGGPYFDTYPEDHYYLLPAGRFVPPGTMEIRGTYAWAGGPPGINWRPTYHSADMQPGTWKVASGTPKADGTFEFVIPVTSEMTDSFYQKASLWRFSHINDLPETIRANAPVPYPILTQWTTSAVVHRDPAYVELPPQ